MGVLLAVATTVLYYPASSHPFSNFDDDVYVTGNSHVKAGLQWTTIKWAATTFDACNWHPVTWLSHAADYEFFGLDPAAHHLTNLVLHVVNVLLLFLVLLGATGAAGPSFVVAALFALHPLNVESVAWVAERKNLLSLFFFLLALGAYRWYARAPRIGRYAVLVLLYVLALMAKPQVVTFPFVLLLWDYWPLYRFEPGSSRFDLRVSPETSRQPFWRTARSEERKVNGEKRSSNEQDFLWLVLEKLPLLVFSAASAVVTVQAQRASGAIRWFPFPVRAENAIVAYALYLKKAFWPSRLALIYPHPEHALPVWTVAASLAFLLAVTAWVIRERQRRYLLVGWFWFLGTLVPMIGLVQVGGQAMADRYAYLPLIGLFVMICWGAREWGATHHIESGWLAGASAAALLTLAAVTHHQLAYWADNVGLWQHTLAITSNNWLAENNLGAALLGENRPEDAIAHFRRSAAIYPDDPVSHLDIGYYEQHHGNWPAAFAEYRKVIVLAPKEKQGIVAEAHNNMGFAYLAQGDPAKARAEFQTAVVLNPQHDRAWIGLGVATQKTGDLSSATQDYSRSLQIQPSDLAYLLLAQVLELQGRTAEAEAATQQARSISANFEQVQRRAHAFVGN